MVALSITLFIVAAIAISLMVLGVLFIIGYFNNRAERAAEKLRKALIAIFKFIWGIIRMPFQTAKYLNNLNGKKRKKLISIFSQRPIRVIKFLNHKNGH